MAEEQIRLSQEEEKMLAKLREKAWGLFERDKRFKRSYKPPTEKDKRCYLVTTPDGDSLYITVWPRLKELKPPKEGSKKIMVKVKITDIAGEYHSLANFKSFTRFGWPAVNGDFGVIALLKAWFKGFDWERKN